MLHLWRSWEDLEIYAALIYGGIVQLTTEVERVCVRITKDKDKTKTKTRDKILLWKKSKRHWSQMWTPASGISGICGRILLIEADHSQGSVIVYYAQPISCIRQADVDMGLECVIISM